MLAIGRWLSKRFDSFRKDRRASVATTFALSLIPMMGLLGAATDYATVVATRAKIQGIADAAALAAVNDTTVKPTLTWPQQYDESKKAAKDTFEALLALANMTGASASGTYEIKLEGTQVTAKVCYSGTQQVMAMALAGFASMEFNGCAKASSAPPLYVTVYVLADASGSMGIGASSADQSLMEKRLGCTFACHTLDWKTAMFNPTCENRGSWDDGSKTTTCAHKIGAKTRFDIVRGALVDVMDDASKMEKLPDQFRFAVYKFSNTLTEVLKETSDLNTAKATTQKMEMDVAGAGSNFRVGMRELLKKIPTSGDGKTADKPKVMLLLMTDGVEGNVKEYSECRKANVNGKNQNVCNYWGSWNGDNDFVLNNPGFYSGAERSQAIDVKVCDGFKSKGVTVATLNTEYVTPPGSGDSRYKQIESMLKPVIRSTMRSCATLPEFAYFATTPGEIQMATEMMFKSLMLKARIVQ